MGERQTTISERITFAEDWVVRARRQIQDGDVTHGTLTLLLAQAELQRAREVGPPRAAPRRTLGPWAVAALAVVLAVAAVSIVEVPGHVPLAAQTEIPIMIRLPDRHGTLLQVVTVPEPVAAPASVPLAPVPAPARVARPVRRPAVALQVEEHRAPVPVRPATELPASPTPAVAPPAVAPPAAAAPVVVAPAVAPAVTLLSAADVIDLVLAAERSLRRPADR